MLDLLYDIISDIFEPNCQITEQTRFDEDLFADFQDMQELLMIVEEEFDILTDDDKIESLVTIADLEEYIKECKEND